MRQISGDAHFNEVFFDDVVVEEDATVGPVDGGWGVALTTLMFERVTIGLGGEGFGWRADRFAGSLLAAPGAEKDREVRHRFGELAADFIALRFTGYRMLTTLQQGRIPGPEGGLAKVTTIKAAIEAGELLADTLGPDALSMEAGAWGKLIADLPGLKSAGGTEEILRNMVGERVLGLPPEPRLDKGLPFSELRAKEKRSAGEPAAWRAKRRSSSMNFTLTEEQEFLQEAARNALGRVKTVEAARDALEGSELPDLWPAATEAGWPGLLISEANEGAGLEPIDAMLVFVELGKVLASVPLLGHLPATFVLDRGGADTGLLSELAAGSKRACFVGAEPPSGIEDTGSSPPSSGSVPACRRHRGLLGSRTRRAPTSTWSSARARRRSTRRQPSRSSRSCATTRRGHSGT